jgi:hypothetical protein
MGGPEGVEPGEVSSRVVGELFGWNASRDTFRPDETVALPRIQDSYVNGA